MNSIRWSRMPYQECIWHDFIQYGISEQIHVSSVFRNNITVYNSLQLLEQAQLPVRVSRQTDISSRLFPKASRSHRLARGNVLRRVSRRTARRAALLVPLVERLRHSMASNHGSLARMGS